MPLSELLQCGAFAVGIGGSTSTEDQVPSLSEPPQHPCTPYSSDRHSRLNMGFVKLRTAYVGVARRASSLDVWTGLTWLL